MYTDGRSYTVDQTFSGQRFLVKVDTLGDGVDRHGHLSFLNWLIIDGRRRRSG